MATAATDSAAFCEVCDEENDALVAVAICFPCREFYCQSCVRTHQKFRETKDHAIVYLLGKSSEEGKENLGCEICDESNAVNVCKTCKQFYCQKCSAIHKKFAATKSHELLQVNLTGGLPCKESELASDFEGSLRITSSSDLQAQVVVSTDENDKRIQSAQEKPNIPNDPNPDTQRVTNLKEAGQFPLKLPTEDKCYITGITTLPDNKVALIDHANDCLKVYDPNFRFLFKVGKIGNSFGVASIGGQEVAVINSSKIEFYRLDGQNSKKIDKVYQTKAFARDICFRSNHLAIVYSAGTIQGVQVYDINGGNINYNSITTVQNEKVDVGHRVEFNKDGSSYFVKISPKSNYKDRWVVGYSVDGHYLWHTSVQGGLMALAVVNDALMVFCGHTYVLAISPDRGTQKTIGATERSVSCLHYDHKLKRILYYNTSRDNLYIINYP